MNNALNRSSLVHQAVSSAASVSSSRTTTAATTSWSFSRLLGLIGRASGCLFTSSDGGISTRGSSPAVCFSTMPTRRTLVSMISRDDTDFCLNNVSKNKNVNGFPFATGNVSLSSASAFLPGSSSAVRRWGKFGRCHGSSIGLDAVARRGASTDAGITFIVTEDAKHRNADPGCVAFVTGANRGIGLEITRQLLEKTKGTIVAACRDPAAAADLRKLGEMTDNEGRLDVVAMDVTDQASVEGAAAHTKDKYGRLDLLFNVAGILGDGKNTPGPERSLRAMDREWLRKTFEVNTIGPMMLVSALAPLLESPAPKKGKANEGASAGRGPSVVVNFSGRVGTIGDNGMGGWHSYRMSKTALNMATKGISLELRRRRVWAFSYHPGTTDTGLSEPFQANVKPEKLFTPTYTVSQVLGIVDSMTEDLSGGFYAFDGTRIAW